MPKFFADGVEIVDIEVVNLTPIVLPPESRSSCRGMGRGDRDAKFLEMISSADMSSVNLTPIVLEQMERSVAAGGDYGRWPCSTRENRYFARTSLSTCSS